MDDFNRFKQSQGYRILDEDWGDDFPFPSIYDELIELDMPETTGIHLHPDHISIRDYSGLNKTFMDEVETICDKYGAKIFKLGSTTVRIKDPDSTSFSKYPELDESRTLLHVDSSLNEDYDNDGEEDLTVYTYDPKHSSNETHRIINTPGLKKVVIPDGITSIPSGQFGGCIMLREVVIPNSVTCIGSNAFYECKSLQKIIIPSSVTTIKSHAFDECYNLQEVVLSYGLTYIGDSVFMDCRLLQKIVIPDSVAYIGSEAFSGCDSLQEIAVRGARAIGAHAFWHCHSLKKIALPDSLPGGYWDLGEGALSECWRLQEVTLPKGITNILGSLLSGCQSLQRITIPDGVAGIGGYAFSSCRSLQEIRIPDSVTSIGEAAFWRCVSLQEITIPGSVVSIDRGAFKDCENLKTLTVRGSYRPDMLKRASIPPDTKILWPDAWNISMQESYRRSGRALEEEVGELYEDDDGEDYAIDHINELVGRINSMIGGVYRARRYAYELADYLGVHYTDKTNLVILSVRINRKLEETYGRYVNLIKIGEVEDQ